MILKGGRNKVSLVYRIQLLEEYRIFAYCVTREQRRSGERERNCEGREGGG